MIEELKAAALRAGSEIMRIYDSPQNVREKADGSPLTEADEAAEAVILAALSSVAPSIPVVAEEAVAAGKIPNSADCYFLVDPLDGTREFLKRNGEFTVNIAFVEKGRPRSGVVYAPALSEIYWADEEGRAWYGRVDGDEIVGTMELNVRPVPEKGLTAVASRSHLSEETREIINRFEVAEMVSVGSSLKLCLVAAGKADIYPRISPTMQWDIAAGHAVLSAAGGHVLKASDKSPLDYVLPEKADKDDLLNPSFIAVSDPGLLAGL